MYINLYYYTNTHLFFAFAHNIKHYQLGNNFANLIRIGSECLQISLLVPTQNDNHCFISVKGVANLHNFDGRIRKTLLAIM